MTEPSSSTTGAWVVSNQSSEPSVSREAALDVAGLAAQRGAEARLRASGTKSATRAPSWSSAAEQPGAPLHARWS